MKKGMVILLIVILIVALAAVYITFFYYPNCPSISCWDSKLIKCSRAKYLNDANDITWKYTIKGEQVDKCIVNVEVLKVKQGLTKTIIMEGKDMNCALPKEVIAVPESDITICKGILKEEMQTLIIEKLHQYILANVNKIGEELKNIEAITNTTGSNIINYTNSSA